MVAQLKLGDTEATVLFKDIKNIHLSVYPPLGKVRISAPLHMKMDTLRVYAISKLEWIRKQQNKLRSQLRESPRDYSQHESQYLWGRRYLLKVVQTEAPSYIEIKPRAIYLHIRPLSTLADRNKIVSQWYRDQVREATQKMIGVWAPRLKVPTPRLFVQHMKTRWGSCNSQSVSIRINTEIAKKPRECLEYIVVHELAHLREPNHGHRFTGILDQALPNWRELKALLNRLPVRHEDWEY